MLLATRELVVDCRSVALTLDTYLVGRPALVDDP